MLSVKPLLLVSLFLVISMTVTVSASDQMSGGSVYHDQSGTSMSDTDQATGEKLYKDSGCLECHGPRGYSEDPAMLPKIAGLDKQYIVDQLLAFQSGKRQNVIMSPVAAMLSADDIVALAAFVSVK